MTRAVTYARVSYDDRSRPADNLQGQLEMYREYCTEKGYSIMAELAEDDRGASGASWDLPELNKALDMARAGDFDVLVTRELDRFARKLAKQLVIEAEFKRLGVEVEYVLEQYDDTPEGQLAKNIRAVIAEFESEKIVQRMRRGRRLVCKSGRVMLHGTRPPYGYHVQDKKLVICEEEARIIKLIFTLYVQGDDGERLGSRAIARRLTKMRVPTWTDTTESPLQKLKGFAEWSHTTIGDILSNDTYKGTWYYGRGHDRKDRAECIEVEVPPIVSEEIWQAAQERKAHNKRMASRRTKHDYLLQKRAVCGHCNSPMSARTVVGVHGGYAYYYCPNRAGTKVNPQKCDNVYFRVDQVDRITLGWLFETLESPNTLKHKAGELRANQEEAAKPLQERLAVIDDLLEEHRTQLSRLLDLYLAGDFDKEMLTERKARLETTIAGLEGEKAKVTLMLERAQSWSDDRIDAICNIAYETAQGLVEAGRNFESRRYYVEELDVQAFLYVEDGQQFARLWCALRAPRDLSIEADSLKTTVQTKTTLAR